MPPELAPLLARSTKWLHHAALPLWSQRGFHTSGFFEEQLEFAGVPVTSVPLRLMLQARQIATFCAAALSGRFAEGADLAINAGHRMCERYYRADGGEGWVFSLHRDGGVADPRRDLYAHAFVLFALGWLVRLDGSAVFARRTAQTMAFIDGAFADKINGGYWDSLPQPPARRLQNQHMHLLEAFLALHSADGDLKWLEYCRPLVRLARDRFVNARTGALREYFDAHWNVIPAPGRGSVEPGHLFEWAWLIRRFAIASGEPVAEMADTLTAFAVRHGLDHRAGRIVDETGEDGAVRTASSRCWPHSEALKAFSLEAMTGDSRHLGLIAPVLARLSDAYCRPELNGGWIDELDSDDRPVSTIMPASLLYHLYFGICEAERLGRPPEDGERPASPRAHLG